MFVVAKLYQELDSAIASTNNKNVAWVGNETLKVPSQGEPRPICTGIITLGWHAASQQRPLLQR